MHLPTLAGMRFDLIDKVVDVTTFSYPVLPYMNMHQYPIKIDHADMSRMSYPSRHLRSNTMECKIKLLTEKIEDSAPLPIVGPGLFFEILIDLLSKIDSHSMVTGIHD